MTKLRLVVFAIMAVSLMIGTSSLVADAARPEIVQEKTNVNHCGAPTPDDLCFTDPDPGNLICGELNTYTSYDLRITKTDFGKEKFKYVRDYEATIYNSEDQQIGTITSLSITNGHYEGNGATVVRAVDTVNCEDGSTQDIIRDIKITNKGNKN